MENFRADTMSDKIVVHNADGLCALEYCSQKPTHFVRVRLFGLPLFVVLCDKHAEEYDNLRFKSRHPEASDVA